MDGLVGEIDRGSDVVFDCDAGFCVEIGRVPSYGIGVCDVGFAELRP